MSISSIKKILLAGTALVAVAGFGTQAQATSTDTATGSGIWAASAAPVAGSGVPTAAQGDNLALGAGAWVTTVTNNGVANDGEGLNTFTLGAVTGGNASNALNIVTGTANDLTVNIGSFAKTVSIVADTINNTAFPANAVTVIDAGAWTSAASGTTITNSDTTTAKAVGLTVGGNYQTVLTTVLTSGSFVGANTNLTLNGATNSAVAVTLTDTAGGTGGISTLTLGGTAVQTFSGTIAGGAANEGVLTVSNTGGTALAGAISNLRTINAGAGVAGTVTSFSTTVGTTNENLTGLGTITNTGALTATNLNLNAAGVVNLNAAAVNAITNTTFNAAGTVNVGAGGTLTSTVTTATTGTGTLTFAAAGTQAGQVGTAAKQLATVNAGVGAVTFGATSFVNATTLNVTGANTVSLNGAAGLNTIGTTAFGASGGTVSIADTGNLTGNITTTANTSTLTLAGGSTITGNIGAGASGALTSLLAINAGVAGKTDIFNGNVNANTLALGAGTGTVEIGSGSSLTAAVTGSAAATLSFLGGTQTSTGTITDTAAIIDVNTAAGTTTFVNAVSAATLNVGALEGATFDAGLTTTAALTNPGTVTIAGGASTTGAITNTGTINVTGGSLGAGANAITNAGTISLTGGGLTTTSSFTNNGATALATIGTGQTLAANSVGAGTSGNTLAFEVKSSGGAAPTYTNGLLSVTNGAALVGTNISVNFDPTSAVLKTGAAFDVINSTGATGAINPLGVNTAITATPLLVKTVGVDKFYAVTGAQTLTSGFGTAALGGTSADVYLVAVQQSATSLGSAVTSNDANLYTALSTISASATDAACVTTACTQLKTAIAGVNSATGTSATAAHNALQALMPPGADGGAQNAALTVGAETQSISNTRMAALRDGDTTSGVAAGASSHGVSMWLEGYGQHANQDTLDGVNGYGATTWGGAVGVDTSSMFDKAIVGVALNYGSSTVNSSDVNATTTDLGNYGVNVYGTYDLGQKMFVNGQVGFAYNTIDSTRHNVGVAGTNAAGSTSSDQYSALLDAGRDYPVGGGMTLTPDVSAAYTYLNTAGYTETGAGGLDNTVASNNQNVLGLGIGGTAAWKLQGTEDGVLKPSVHAGYTYEAIDDRINTSSSFVGDPASTIFINEGASPSRSVFDVGAKLVYATKANWDFSANYDFQAKTSYTSNTGELRATAHF